MIPILQVVQDQVKQTEKKDTPNEYYKIRWSDETSGIVYVKQKEGYSQIRYGWKDGTFWVDWSPSKQDFDSFLAKRTDLIQISKLDALPALQFLRQQVMSL